MNDVVHPAVDAVDHGLLGEGSAPTDTTGLSIGVLGVTGTLEVLVSEGAVVVVEACHGSP